MVGTNGTLTFTDTTNVTVSAGANASTAITLEGNPQSLNTTLNGFTFLSTEHFNGSETIRVIIDDLGNKDGAAQTLERTIDITVTPINDEPINTLPVAQNTNEDTPLVLSQANSNQISVADPDSGDNSQNLTITLTDPDFDNDSVIDGTLTFSTTNGLTFDTSVGGGDGTIPASLLHLPAA